MGCPNGPHRRIRRPRSASSDTKPGVCRADAFRAVRGIERYDGNVRKGVTVVGEAFDVTVRWPELFAQLDEAQRDAVTQALAVAWHEGWTPTREDVENLTDRARGAIDAEEYRRRAHAAARRAAATLAR